MYDIIILIYAVFDFFIKYFYLEKQCNLMLPSLGLMQLLNDQWFVKIDRK